MRRLFLCFLLCLMPLRLWAGAWMPLLDKGPHQLPAETTLTLVQPVLADVVHDCHETMAGTFDEAHAQSQAQPDTAAQKTDCHEGTCQLCGVCHQSASLALWPWLLEIRQAHPLPVGVPRAYLARASAPLIKPPIS